MSANAELITDASHLAAVLPELPPAYRVLGVYRYGRREVRLTIAADSLPDVAVGELPHLVIPSFAEDARLSGVRVLPSQERRATIGHIPWAQPTRRRA